MSFVIIPPVSSSLFLLIVMVAAVNSLRCFKFLHRLCKLRSRQSTRPLPLQLWDSATSHVWILGKPCRYSEILEFNIYFSQNKHPLYSKPLQYVYGHRWHKYKSVTTHHSKKSELISMGSSAQQSHVPSPPPFLAEAIHMELKKTLSMCDLSSSILVFHWALQHSLAFFQWLLFWWKKKG